MGGKRLVFPKRRKYVFDKNSGASGKKQEITAEEHEARLKVLRDMGLIK